ncbi:MAG TPA: 2-C-methyl-D-erythritol 4-phosphate cytidylyltransferase [candidate division Zixibacteria bacterium]
MKTVAIIVAAGKGERIKSKLPKQFLNLGKKPILAHTIEKFEKSRLVDEIVVVVPKDYLSFCSKEIVDRFGFGKIGRIVSGGKERQDSVFRGLKAINSTMNIVLIHDGVRPLVKTQKINKIIEVCRKEGPVIFALPVKETIKRVEKNRVITTLDRNKIWAVQTPQAFSYQLIMHAYKEANKDKFIGTDDSQLVERMGIAVKVIKGDENNIKITTMDDLKIAEYLVSLRD